MVWREWELAGEGVLLVELPRLVPVAPPPPCPHPRVMCDRCRHSGSGGISRKGWSLADKVPGVTSSWCIKKEHRTPGNCRLLKRRMCGTFPTCILKVCHTFPLDTLVMIPLLMIPLVLIPLVIIYHRKKHWDLSIRIQTLLRARYTVQTRCTVQTTNFSEANLTTYKILII